ncbi:MAG: cupin domain-containing protein [Lachnospiraceae bacterium]|nr:cupin domain-containing protein [Lachnospiraceae bacterium]
MNLILLSGGSGKRLWPLSNDVRSKQFIKIFKTGEDTYESMLQRVYRQIRTVDKEAVITIATSKSQVSSIHNQIGEEVGISVEPARRDTFPAIALAAAYLHDVQNVPEDEAVVVCPIDPFVEEDYFRALSDLQKLSENDTAALTLMGIEPTYPSEKYGYILPQEEIIGTSEILQAPVQKVLSFKEKPDVETAKEYIAKNALWNGGVFAFRLRYVLQKAKEYLGSADYYTLFDNYENLPKISFDYAVVEKESDIAVMRFCGEWRDLGTWNTLTESMEESVIGNGILNETCENVHVLNELDMPILCMGLKNIIVSASPEGVLVSDKEQSSYIKPYVDAFTNPVMFAEKSWGSFKVIDVQEKSMTILVTLNPGHQMNYHAHNNRNEVWTVIEGKGRTIVDGMEQQVEEGDVITMERGCKHTIIAETTLKLIEVQLGENISVHDKQKFRLDEIG